MKKIKSFFPTALALMVTMGLMLPQPKTVYAQESFCPAGLDEHPALTKLQSGKFVTLCPSVTTSNGYCCTKKEASISNTIN